MIVPCGLHHRLPTAAAPQRIAGNKPRGKNICDWLRSSCVACSREIPTGPVIRGLGVITSSTLVVAHSATGTKRRSRLVRMPTSRGPTVTGTPLMRKRDMSARASATAADEGCGCGVSPGPADASWMALLLVWMVCIRRRRTAHPT